ncbi:MAG: hypothetical protein EBW25_06540, partial [Actinobacteria bacterium]|nr:hypothetical protein [Actinomycetota bacterium]
MQPVRWLGIASLIFYIFLHQAISSPWVELLAYNIVAIASIAVVLSAPHISDPITKPFTAIAASSFITLGTAASVSSNLLYLIFYPIAVISLPRLLAASRKLKLLELFDASIVGLGLGTLGTAILMKPLAPHFVGNIGETFFAIMFPISDLILLAVVVAAMATQGFSRRGLTLTTGVLIYTSADLYFLWQQTNQQYLFGSLIDLGWLIGLIIIAESFWQTGIDEQRGNGLSPILVSIS